MLVSSQRDRETSKVPVSKTSYEEAWPSLGSPVKGQGKVPSRAHASGTKAWSTQKGPWILKEQNSETSNLQTVSDRETSKVPVPKTSYEEAWPSLGSPVKGQGIIIINLYLYTKSYHFTWFS